MAATALFTPHRGNHGRRASHRVSHLVIYGAGDAGVQLASALSYSQDQRPVAFFDDAASLHKQQIAGLKIHPFSDLSRLIKKLDVHEVLLALPSTSHSRRREIITMLEPYPVHVRTLPGLSSIAQPGEKLYEELLIGENALPTEHSRIMRAEEEVLPWSDVERLLQEFDQAAGENNPVRVRELLLEAVSGFEPQCEVKDVVMKHQHGRDALPPVEVGKVESQDETPAVNVVQLH